MKALRVKSREGLDLSVDVVGARAPAAGEVAVEIEAGGLNHLDLLLVSGRLGLDVSLPHIVGIEGAGRIVAVGDGVSEDRMDERVTIYPYVSCGNCPFCYVGEDQCCPTGQIRCIGLTLPGTMAEIVTVPARNAIPLPDDVPALHAAAVSMTGMTAYRLVVTRGRIRPGETVLVRAAGSGVGSIAVQLARAVGARVIGTAGSEHKLEKAAQLGMDDGINHAEGSIVKRVKELTDGRGVDVVLDYVGAATWDDNVRSLARGGRVLVCGAHTGTDVGFDLWHFFAKEHQFLGSYGGTRDDLRSALGLVSTGSISPVIHDVVTLGEAGRALASMDRRAHFGKLIVSVNAGGRHPAGRETSTSDA